MLEQLKGRGLRLGLISNVSLLPDLMREDLRALGILRHLDAVTFSSEAGTRKPDARIFLRVLEELRVPSEEAVFVGDRVGDDIARATPAEREYMRAMAMLGDEPVQTSSVADELGRKPSIVSPARDGLIKKGLIYSSERGLIAFTVPHFGRFLRAQPA